MILDNRAVFREARRASLGGAILRFAESSLAINGTGSVPEKQEVRE